MYRIEIVDLAETARRNHRASRRLSIYEQCVRETDDLCGHDRSARPHDPHDRHLSRRSGIRGASRPEIVRVHPGCGCLDMLGEVREGHIEGGRYARTSIRGRTET